MRARSRRSRGKGGRAGFFRAPLLSFFGAVLLGLGLLVACAPRRAAAPEMAADPYAWDLADGATRSFVLGPQGLEPLAAGSGAFPAAPEGGAAVEEGRTAPEILLAAGPTSAAGPGGQAAAANPGGAAAAAPASPGGAADPGGAAAAAAPAVAAGSATIPGSPLAAFALEGWGAAFLEMSPDGSSLHLRQMALPGLDGLKLGGLWSREGSLLLASFRDPFADEAEGTGAAEAGSASAREVGPRPATKGALYKLGPQGLEPLALPPLAGLEPSYELFAFLPRPGSEATWLAQFRDSAGPRSRSLWAAYPSLGGTGRLIRREDFEAALAPRSLVEAPAPLRRALEALGPERPASALLHIAGDSAASGWYGWGGDPAEARELQASADGAGNLLLLAPGGEAVLLRAGAEPRRLDLKPPLAGAFFEACALVELPGPAPAGNPSLLLAAVWRGGGSAGILLAPALE